MDQSIRREKQESKLEKERVKALKILKKWERIEEEKKVKKDCEDSE